MKPLIKNLLLAMLVIFAFIFGNFSNNDADYLYSSLEECKQVCLEGEEETRDNERILAFAFINFEDVKEIKCNCHYNRKIVLAENVTFKYTDEVPFL